MENKSFVAQWVYTDTVKDHFMNPRNIWKDDEDFSADGTGEVGSLACGDQMRVGIRRPARTQVPLLCAGRQGTQGSH